ncbi:TetR/AcrR family transcriptional regulator [Nonomuraea aridisoli]|uniref:TetR family transcriptional regulator n=1 Tax=Nonomuraea aridisoli TaxID=2070368 RepID=A0A2W2D9D0_9ACTN|nr:TetR/AcrR family transcriptional regulator [Nonomuraea aridisoli]PZG08576.1 TetR family transcriptional regulator [Nonomuraea aridisoli]
MDRREAPGGSLRERKQRLAREAIIEAALALFDERGFEKVTVTDIAERAQVGRATFFRYFGDKQEVVFADGGAFEAVLAEAGGPRADDPIGDPPGDPIGDSLPAALAFARAVAVSYITRLTADPAAYNRHERLVDSHPELRARSLIKQRGHAEVLRELLESKGAGRETAALAAEVAVAAYHAARTITGDRPQELPAAVEAAFDRLAGVDGISARST